MEVHKTAILLVVAGSDKGVFTIPLKVVSVMVEGLVVGIPSDYTMSWLYKGFKKEKKVMEKCVYNLSK